MFLILCPITIVFFLIQSICSYSYCSKISYLQFICLIHVCAIPENMRTNAWGRLGGGKCTRQTVLAFDWWNIACTSGLFPSHVTQQCCLFHYYCWLHLKFNSKWYDRIMNFKVSFRSIYTLRPSRYESNWKSHFISC